jgi:TrmH family RNA methyltransferase
LSVRDHQGNIVPLTKPEAAAIRKLRQPRERKVTKRFVIEGVRAVNEALSAGLGMHRAVVSPRLDDVEGGSKVRAALNKRGVPLAEVPDRTLKSLSDTDSPQGVVVVGIEPPVPLASLEPTRGVLALDGIQDPGNVGTLIRSAHAFGLGGVVALEGTADPWGSKAVRASAGSLFHLPVSRSSTAEFLSWCRRGGDAAVRILAAAPGSGPPAPAPARWVLVVGSEGKGIGDILLEAADEVVSVAMPGGSESLNAAVAGSLLLHQLVTSRESLVHKMEAQ